MLFPNYKVHHLRRVMAMVLSGLALLLLSGYVLGGCAAVTDVTPSSQVQTPLPSAKSPTPPLPTEQPTAPVPLPSPEQTAPIIPTPVLTLEPTFPPRPPTPTQLPTPPPLPTLTVGPPILLIRPVPDPKQAGMQWFASTGHTLRGTFLDYWNAHGGAEQFGLPLTEEFVEARGPDLKPFSVQYFEKAIFESNPENKGSEIVVQSGQMGFGAQKLRENGYDAGAYPRYGHAADFSWLSGQMILKAPLSCTRPECGCSLVLYEGPNTRVQLDGGTWRLLSERYRAQATREEYLTLFGRITPPGQVDNNCYIGKDTMHVYVVEDVQANRTP